MKMSRLQRILTYSILTLGTALILFPLYLTIITALKTPAESAKNFFSFPTSLYLDNFTAIFKKANYFKHIMNSVFITASSVVLIGIIAPMGGYAIARNMDNSKYYKFLFYYVILGIFVPFQVVMIPLVKLMGRLNMMSKTGLIVLHVTFALIQGTFLFVNYIRSIPRELEESAYIDGCGIWQTYYKIVFPLIKPMTATVLTINCLWVWNDFFLPLLILNRSQSDWTLPLFQFNFRSQYTFDYNLAFASYLLAMLPILIIYVFSQKYIISGLTKGAVKS
jgi:raffinose/stachyose/melibiose transport system permease protein